MAAIGDEAPITDMEVEEEAMLTASKDKQTKGVSKAKGVKTPVNHPPYRQMIAEALSEMKERNGSSQKAIAKFIEQKYKTYLQPNMKVLGSQLKKLAKAGELTRTKNSFKLKQAKKAEKKKKKSDAAKAKQTAKSAPRKTPRFLKTATAPSEKN